jgi:hypothetical protein
MTTQQTTTMIAGKAFKYGRKPLQPRDEFEAEDRHVLLLQVAKLAAVKDEPKSKRARRSRKGYERRDMRPRSS